MWFYWGDFVINQDKINKALLFASVNHEGQKMKQPDVSYVAHLQGVCYLMAQNKIGSYFPFIRNA